MPGSFTVLIALLLSCVIYIGSLVWVYRDAEQRGKSGLLVVLLAAVIAWPLGLVLWLIVRPKEAV